MVNDTTFSRIRKSRLSPNEKLEVNTRYMTWVRLTYRELRSHGVPVANARHAVIMMLIVGLRGVRG